MAIRYLILVRHGQTEDNVLNDGPEGQQIVTGQSETPLTTKGREQAVAAGKKLAALRDVHIRRVVSSDLQRVTETAELVLDQLHQPLPIETFSALRERSCGVFERRWIKDLREEYPEYFSDPNLIHWRTDFSQKAPGGESFSDVLARLVPCMETILKETDGDILCTSHIRIISCILHWLLKLPESDTVRLQIPNSDLIVVEMRNPPQLIGEWTIERLLTKK